MGFFPELLFKIKFAFLNLLKGRRPAGGVPDMTFMDQGGRPVTLRSLLAEKAGGLLWMTNLCEGCDAKFPLFQKVHARYGDRLGLAAVSVLGRNRQRPAELRAKHEIGFAFLEDPEDEIGGVLGFAHPGGACPLYNLILFGADRKIRFRTHLSAVKEDALFAELEKVLAIPASE